MISIKCNMCEEECFPTVERLQVFVDLKESFVCNDCIFTAATNEIINNNQSLEKTNEKII